MIAEVVLPKSGVEASGKEVSELYDDERQGELMGFQVVSMKPSGP
jgi:hypothetical protein